MKTILEELYDGNVYPDELIVPKDPGYPPLREKMSTALEMWKQKLSEEDYGQFESLLDLRSEMSSMEASATFVYGFKLGALIMLEVLGGKEDIVRGNGG